MWRFICDGTTCRRADDNSAAQRPVTLRNIMWRLVEAHSKSCNLRGEEMKTHMEAQFYRPWRYLTKQL